jgi:DNA polymerase elongation subunit (family B)
MRQVSKHARMLVLDIETAPLEAYVWGLWEQNVGLDFIKTEWSILAFAAQWLDEKKPIYADAGGRGAKKVRDDLALTKQIRSLLDEADIVIAQNGKRFDIRKINARMVIHGFEPPAPYRVVDTMVEAKKYFAFTSQKLAWTSKYLTDEPKSEHKKFPGFELWVECLKDNPAAWAEMKKYNIQDIKATTEVYFKLRPWITNHPNMGMYDRSDIANCPNCGSEHLQCNGYRTTQQGVYHRYRCQDCGSSSRGKQMAVSPAMRKAKLVGA